MSTRSLKRAQLARGGQRIASGARLDVDPLGGEIEDRQVERLVRQPRQRFGERLRLQYESLARQRAGDAAAFEAIGERD